MESRTSGTMLLRQNDCVYKVLNIHSQGNNNVFQCIELATKKDKVLQFNLSWLLEAAECAFKVMKSPKDIFFLDLDRSGEWKVFNEEQLSSLK